MIHSVQSLVDQDAEEFKAEFPAYQDIVSRLGQTVEVSCSYIDICDAFSITFARMFITESPDYEMENGKHGASRSNWTYHTALAFAQTSKMFGLTCKFETQGKRDAVIQTKDEPPETILVAEWEWDYLDVFGKGKELEKLRDSCRQFRNAEALLLTYCPQDKYVNYFHRIAEYWTTATKRRKDSPALYLHAIIYPEEGSFRTFERLRSVKINSQAIQIWNDQLF